MKSPLRAASLSALGLTAALAFATAASAQSVPTTPAPEGARVYFVKPRHGAKVDRKFTVIFGLKGMGVAPAGVDMPNTGHHHLIIDSPTPESGKPIPGDDKHIHFGGGQTQTEIELPVGKHTLQLVLADKNHMPFEPMLKSALIEVTVVDREAEATKQKQMREQRIRENERRRQERQRQREANQ